MTRYFAAESIRGLDKEKYEFTSETSKCIDAIILPGGGDVTPALYGKTIGPSHAMSIHPDYIDMCRIMNARSEGIPVIGICKGAQLIHVSNGGTLTQNIDNHPQLHGLVDYDGSPIKGYEGAEVNSTHHQAVPPEEAEELYDYVYCSDDLQATEVFGHIEKKLFGFQFHPEYTSCPDSGVKIFRDFMDNVLFN